MRLLLIVYKIEAGKGSEDESGYQFVRHLAQQDVEITLISRTNNCEKLALDPRLEHVRMVPVDVPRWASFYKRGPRGIIPYYYSWQIAVGHRVRQMLKRETFDILHLFNFHADWAPHFLPSRPPTIWGPIAHHQLPPFERSAIQSTKPFAGEVGRSALKQAFWRLDPFLHFAAHRTAAIVYANPDIAPPFRARQDIHLRPYAGSNPAFRADTLGSDGFRALFVGRLVPLKGPLLALAAWAHFLDIVPRAAATLRIVGAGPLHKHVVREISRLGLHRSVEVLPWLSRDDLAAEYRDAALLLYPSVEAQGLVVGEAMASGVPVLGIAGTGPSYLAGDAGVMVSRSPARTLVGRLGLELEALYGEFTCDFNSYRRRFTAARLTYETRLDWDRLISDFMSLYDGLANR